MRDLCRALLRIKVRPYYLFHCDPVIGAGHFRTSVWKGMEIMEGLRGHMSGLGIPTYVVDSPHGGGKIPLMPNYLLSASDDAVVLRNYEGMLVRYHPTGEAPQTSRLDRDPGRERPAGRPGRGAHPRGATCAHQRRKARLPAAAERARRALARLPPRRPAATASRRSASMANGNGNDPTAMANGHREWSRRQEATTNGQGSPTATESTCQRRSSLSTGKARTAVERQGRTARLRIGIAFDLVPAERPLDGPTTGTRNSTSPRRSRPSPTSCAARATRSSCWATAASSSRALLDDPPDLVWNLAEGEGVGRCREARRAGRARDARHPLHRLRPASPWPRALDKDSGRRLVGDVRVRVPEGLALPADAPRRFRSTAPLAEFFAAKLARAR